MRFDLRCKLEQVLEMRALDSEIYDFSSGDRLMQWYAAHAGQLDLLFLDIEMEGTGGMETARILRAQDIHLQLVFVPGHPDYVFDGYGVGALGYLWKPPKNDALQDILYRALSALQLEAEDMYYCRNAEGTFRIPKKSILYLCSEKRQVTCQTKSRDYTFYARLGDVAAELGQGFVRIHQRHVVNAAAVEKVTGESVVVDGVSLPISRSYRRESMQALTRALLD